MNKPFIILFVLSISTVVSAVAQKKISEEWQPSFALDSVKKVEWVEVNENDISMQKEVWRVVNALDTFNAPLNKIKIETKRYSLFDIIILLAEEGKLKRYASSGDDTTSINSESNEYLSSINGEVDSYLIKEWWGFDNRLGRMIIRIEEVAPATKISKGEYKPLFWVNYQELRTSLYNYNIEINNGATKLFRDYIEDRDFSSTIISLTKWRKPNR